MWDAGYKSQVCVDFSPTVTRDMSERSGDTRPGLEYATADLTAMPAFADASFDAVVDKGTMDAMVCAKPKAGDTPFGDGHTQAYLSEASRVLKSGGVLVVVSFGAPVMRLPALKRCVPAWADVHVQRIVRPAFEMVPDADESKWHYIYTCTKA